MTDSPDPHLIFDGSGALVGAYDRDAAQASAYRRYGLIAQKCEEPKQVAGLLRLATDDEAAGWVVVSTYLNAVLAEALGRAQKLLRDHGMAQVDIDAALDISRLPAPHT